MIPTRLIIFLLAWLLACPAHAYAPYANEPVTGYGGSIVQIAQNDAIVLAGGPGSTVQLLYLPLSPQIGQQVTVKDASGNAATVHEIVYPANGAGAIDGQPFFTINTNWESVTFVYTSGGWTTTGISLPAAILNGLAALASAPSSGQVPVGQANSVYAPTAISGDGTLNSSGTLSISKTNGATFAQSAIINTTNASNITAGNLPLAQMPSGFTMPMQCRIYLTSGAPTTDGTSTTYHYVGPYGGCMVSLPDVTGNVYQPYVLSEIQVSNPSYIFDNVDVFLQGNPSTGVVSVVETPWDSGGQVSAAITNVSIANPCVLTVTGDVHTAMAAGQLIGIAGIVGTAGSAANGLNGRVYRVVSSTYSAPSTTITLETGINTVGTTYTSGGTAYLIANTRTTGLTWQNGQYHQTGALNNIYIGSYQAGADGVSGQILSNTTSRLIWNEYNRIPGYLIAQDTTSSWTSNLAPVPYAIRNNSSALGVARNEFLIGLVEEPVTGTTHVTCTNGVPTSNSIQLNQIDTFSLTRSLGLTYCNVASSFGKYTGTSSAFPDLGYTFAQVQESNNGTTTYSGAGSLWYNVLNATSVINGRW